VQRPDLIEARVDCPKAATNALDVLLDRAVEDVAIQARGKDVSRNPSSSRSYYALCDSVERAGETDPSAIENDCAIFINGDIAELDWLKCTQVAAAIGTTVHSHCLLAN
jgi:hypothetical protein